VARRDANPIQASLRRTSSPASAGAADGGDGSFALGVFKKGSLSIVMLVDPTNVPITEATVTEGQAAARVLGVNLLIVNGSSLDEIAVAFSSAVAQRAGALLVGPYLFYYSHIEYLVALAAHHVQDRTRPAP
jgi:hypothetical protein